MFPALPGNLADKGGVKPDSAMSTCVTIVLKTGKTSVRVSLTCPLAAKFRDTYCHL